MTQERMTIHRALSELKVLDKRIQDLMSNTSFVLTNKNSNAKINGVQLKDVEDNIKSSYQKINDLISRHSAIKKAIDLSNCVTKVEITEKEYTVVEAINMKNHKIKLIESLCKDIENQYRANNLKAERENADINERAENYVTGMFGGKDSKTSPDTISKLKEDFIESNTIVLVDPIGAVKEVEALKNEIDNFNASVDAVLSESNAVTFIDIEY